MYFEHDKIKEFVVDLFKLTKNNATKFAFTKNAKKYGIRSNSFYLNKALQNLEFISKHGSKSAPLYLWCGDFPTRENINRIATEAERLYVLSRTNKNINKPVPKNLTPKKEYLEDKLYNLHLAKTNIQELKNWTDYDKLETLINKYTNKTFNPSIHKCIGELALESTVATVLKRGGFVNKVNETYILKDAIRPEMIIMAMRDYWKKTKHILPLNKYKEIYIELSMRQNHTTQKHNICTTLKHNINESKEIVDKHDAVISIKKKGTINISELSELKNDLIQQQKEIENKISKIDNVIATINEIYE